MLGQSIAAWRKQIGLTQEQLAEAVGVARGTIAQLETGLIEWPRPETLQKIAETLRIPLHTLLRNAGIVQIDPKLEEEIAELVAQVPELRELLDLARGISTESPESLSDVVRFARWVLEEERKKIRADG